ncbi:MAG: AAA family ATPase [Candidatus Thiodiazotropha sp.]
MTITDDRDAQTRLVNQLLEMPARFPHAADRLDHIETHISHLLLAGEFVYKIKKPLDLGFLDFTTLEKRRRCCEEELRLNRRLAPSLYLAVVAIHGTPDRPTFEPEGPVLEYAVRMRRFRQAELLSCRPPVRDEVRRLAALVADFHLRIPSAPADSVYGTPEVVLQPMMENFRQIRELKQPLLEHERLDPLQTWTEEFAASAAGLLDERREAGHIRECHGDLHLGNITRFEGELTPFDGIEFNPALRWIDTLNDLAFLLMDLQHRGLGGVADLLLNEYLERTGDYAALPLLRFYQLYRAMVRAKVSAIRLSQPGLPREEAMVVLDEYRRYLTLAESVIRHPPALLLLTHGVSGSGKSHIAGWLAEQLMAIRIRSDVERKRLFPQAEDGTRYTSRASDVCYAHLAGMAARLLQAGFVVVVDATFLQRRQRQRFLELGERLQTPVLILDCEAPDAVLRERVAQRAEAGGDASEADLEVLSLQQRQREPLSKAEQRQRIRIDSEHFPPPGLLATVLQQLMG